MRNLIWLVWLTLLQAAFGFVPPNESACSLSHALADRMICLPAIAYDGQNPAMTGYDGSSVAGSGYDTARMPIVTCGANPTVGVSRLFGKSPEFLAAEATVARTASGDFYSVAFESKLSSSSYPGVLRPAHFQEANEALLTTMEGDAQFAQAMQGAGVNLSRTPTGLAPRTSPAGWTWHHAQEPGVMQLVPRSQHAPGSIFQDASHPGGQGGYSIWGQ